jgi:para-aminobenzoate synthetase
VTTLLVDNYDSYTYNLAELIARVTGSAPLVVENDEISCAEALDLRPRRIVLSPGPGSPGNLRDTGISAGLLASAQVPVLGVCLGHQIIAHASGATVTRAAHPAHGTVSAVRLARDPLFAGLPDVIDVVRYHSLAVQTPLPPDLRAIATAEDGTLMALRHANRPLWGVQFHPEAVCTQYGARLIRNFCDLPAPRPPGGPTPPRGGGERRPAPRPGPAPAPRPVRLHLAQREIACKADPQTMYEALYRRRPASFWLDTSAVRDAHGWSFLGAPQGARDHLLTARGTLVTRTGADGTATTRQVASVWTHLRDLLARHSVEGAAHSPFRGGYLGYLGYGLPTATIAAARRAERTPDLALQFVTRWIAVEHASGRVFACAAHTAQERDQALAWLDETGRALETLDAPAPRDRPEAPVAAADLEAALAASALDTRARYEDKVRACIEKIRQGESYEVCLTTGFEGPALRDPFGVYRTLRAVNPAPYAAYLDFGGFQLLSSSPERFLRVGTDRRVETRPIKGTSPRDADPGRDARAAADLARDPKTRAENMMIVDLLRNDLNRVCEVGTVAVDALMQVETHPTVHQLVSTISGRLAPGRGPLDAVESCFPGGSMTGAPKLRTMEIISGLESHPRGAYAGALGMFSLDGYTDLCIVIRSIVNDPRRWFVGAGGAVLIGSDPAAEYAEMIHKAAPCISAILLAGQAGGGAEPAA